MRSLFIIVLGCLSGNIFADTELRFDDGSEVLIKGSKVLFGDRDNSIIYPGDGYSMTVLEHDKRRYMVVDEAFADSVSTQIDAAMAQVEEQLAQLPPEQRAMMRSMLENRMPKQNREPPQQEFRRTNTIRTIAGYECVEGALITDGEQEFTMCISQASEIGMPAGDYAALRKAFAAMSKLVAKFSPGTEQMFNLDLIGGVPIMSRDSSGQEDSRLVSASFAAIEATRLEIPADYKQHDPAAGL